MAPVPLRRVVEEDLAEAENGMEDVVEVVRDTAGQTNPSGHRIHSRYAAQSSSGHSP